MTIAALVSHFGASTPRYVTVNGQVIFDDVAPVTSGGYAHPVHGPVTAVERHTFHAGSEESEDLPASKTPWWDDPNRIERHIQAMQRAFAGFSYLPPADGTAPGWYGQVDTGRGRFTIGVVLRADEGLPRVVMLSKIRLGVSVGRTWMRSPHLYDNGNLCVADVTEWISEEHTAATVVAWAAHWLAAYTEWRVARKWPVSGAHAIAA